MPQSHVDSTKVGRFEIKQAPILQIGQFVEARPMVPQSPHDRDCKLHIYLRADGRLTPELDRLRPFALTCRPPLA
jgi:hypothetical protein